MIHEIHLVSKGQQTALPQIEFRFYPLGKDETVFTVNGARSVTLKTNNLPIYIYLNKD